MHIAQVHAWGQPPVYVETPDLPLPSPTQLRLKILATAVHRLVQARAAGKHYSAHTLPLDPSTDAVGRDESAGDTYYIGSFAAAAFAEYANVEKSHLARLPDGADPITVAVLLNPVSSSWMALRERVSPPPPGFSVLILGVTGTSGSTAIEVVRAMGAGRVVGMARNAKAMDALPGLDEKIVLKEPAAETDFLAVGHVDVVLDYVYGEVTGDLLAALKPERETQYVNIGSLGGAETFALPAQVLRSKMIRITGAGPGSWSIPAMERELPGMLDLAAKLERPKDAITCSLKDIEKVWDSEDAKKKRLVLIP